MNLIESVLHWNRTYVILVSLYYSTTLSVVIYNYTVYSHNFSSSKHRAWNLRCYLPDIVSITGCYNTNEMAHTATFRLKVLSLDVVTRLPPTRPATSIILYLGVHCVSRAFICKLYVSVEEAISWTCACNALYNIRLNNVMMEQYCSTPLHFFWQLMLLPNLTRHLISLPVTGISSPSTNLRESFILMFRGYVL
jgi:hypothetical protein